ncbi:MAG: hypothetical protein QGH62_02665, partial [Nitrospinaceae bacterium]|nr:hypothetical protein [Nitrospinaceae bacterium]
MLAMISMLAAEGASGVSPGWWVLIGILVIIGFVFLIMFGPVFTLWIQALAAGAGVGIFEMIAMR